MVWEGRSLPFPLVEVPQLRTPDLRKCGGQDRLVGAQNERISPTILPAPTLRAKNDKSTLTAAEASKRYGDVTIFVSRDGGDIDGWGESSNLGHGEVTLLHLNRTRAAVRADEKELAVGCHGGPCREAANNWQTDSLEQSYRNSIESWGPAIGFL